VNFIDKYRVSFIKISLVLGFISAMFGSLLAQHYLWKDAYYHLMEIGFVFYLLSFYFLSHKDSQEFTKLWKTITLMILLCSVSTLIDELIYNAQLVEWNDFIRLAFIVYASFKINYKFTLWKTLLNL
jgi:hypothetical protein